MATLYRDPENIEKAFAMGGMKAHSGVRAVELVRSGFTGVADVLDNSPSFFDSYAGRRGGRAEKLADPMRAAD